MPVHTACNYTSRWPTDDFRRLFLFSLKCSGYSPFFAYMLNNHPFICPAYHCTCTKQLMQSQIQIHTHECRAAWCLPTLKCPPCCICTVNNGTHQRCSARNNTCQLHSTWKKITKENCDFSDFGIKWIKARRKNKVIW